MFFNWSIGLAAKILQPQLSIFAGNTRPAPSQNNLYYFSLLLRLHTWANVSFFLCDSQFLLGGCVLCDTSMIWSFSSAPGGASESGLGSLGPPSQASLRTQGETRGRPRTHWGIIHPIWPGTASGSPRRSLRRCRGRRVTGLSCHRDSELDKSQEMFGWMD